MKPVSNASDKIGNIEFFSEMNIIIYNLCFHGNLFLLEEEKMIMGYPQIKKVVMIISLMIIHIVSNILHLPAVLNAIMVIELYRLVLQSNH
jgi:hypothetical protein